MVSLLAPGAAAQMVPVPVPASGARLTPEQVIAVVMSRMEVGANDFRPSAMGPDGDPTYGGGYPDVVYNSSDAEYLVVWFGDTPPLADDEMEIFGQRLRSGSYCIYLPLVFRGGPLA